MIDKWTMGSSNEGLYNGVSPSEERGDRKKKKKHQEITTVAPGKIQPKKKSILSKIVPLGLDSNPLNSPNLTPRT